MNRRLGAELAAGNFNRPVRNDFVGVHVALCAAASLPDTKGKMIVQLSLDDFIRGLHHKPGLIFRQLAKVAIRQCARLFQSAESTDQLRRLDVVADIKMNQGTSGLRTPVAIMGNVDGTHRVRFDAMSFRRGEKVWLGIHGELRDVRAA
jgi:hypothetical protein